MSSCRGLPPEVLHIICTHACLFFIDDMIVGPLSLRGAHPFTATAGEACGLISVDLDPRDPLFESRNMMADLLGVSYQLREVTLNSISSLLEIQTVSTVGRLRAYGALLSYM